jgi:hypothetical protein
VLLEVLLDLFWLVLELPEDPQAARTIAPVASSTPRTAGPARREEAVRLLLVLEVVMKLIVSAALSFSNAFGAQSTWSVGQLPSGGDQES